MLLSSRDSLHGQWTRKTIQGHPLKGHHCQGASARHSSSTKQPSVRVQAIAQEERPATATPTTPTYPSTLPNSQSSNTSNECQIEKLLAHIHKRLPHSKPARALQRDGPALQLEALDDQSTSAQEFHAISEQLHLSLEGNGIHISVLDHEPASPDTASLHVPGFSLSVTPEPEIANLADGLAASWQLPHTAAEQLQPLNLLSSTAAEEQEAESLVADDHDRQREWLQQLLDRPPAIPAVPQLKTTGARTKQCSCGAVVHNRTAVCPECGHEFVAKKARRTSAATSTKPAAPRKQRSPKATPSPAASLPAAAAATPRLSPAALSAPPSPTQHTSLPSHLHTPATSHHQQQISPLPPHHPADTSAAPAPPTAALTAERLAMAISIPLASAKRILASTPSLATLPADKISQRITLLATTLTITRDLAISIATRQPALLTLTPATMRQHFEGICLHLHLHPRDARRFIAKCPDLLHMAPATAAHKLTRLATVMRITPMQVLRLMVAAPKLLSLSLENVREKLLFYRNTLGLKQPARLHKVLRAHPSLLTRSVVSMSAAFGGMAALLGLNEADARRAFQLNPALLLKNCDSVEAKVGQLAELLQLEQEQAIRLAAQNLHLLGLDVSGWDAKVDHLAAALKLSRASVLKMLRRMPSLLGFKAQPLAERLVKMGRSLRLPKERVRLMVEAQPSLLTMKQSVLARRWQALTTLAAADPAWRQQLLSYEVSSMCVLLSRSDDTFLRLQYLVHVGETQSVSVATAMQMSCEKFRARYPEYGRWVNEEVLDGAALSGRRAGKRGLLRAFMKAEMRRKGAQE